MAPAAKTIDEKLTEALGDESRGALQVLHAIADRLIEAIHLDESAEPSVRFRTHRRKITSAKLNADVEFAR